MFLRTPFPSCLLCPFPLPSYPLPPSPLSPLSPPPSLPPSSPPLPPSPPSLPSRCSNCAAVLQVVENEMCRANDMKAEREREKEKLENEVRNDQNPLKSCVMQKIDSLLFCLCLFAFFYECSLDPITQCLSLQLHRSRP